LLEIRPTGLADDLLLESLDAGLEGSHNRLRLLQLGRKHLDVGNVSGGRNWRNRSRRSSRRRSSSRNHGWGRVGIGHCMKARSRTQANARCARK
jgi:hypothetical protein